MSYPQSTFCFFFSLFRLFFFSNASDAEAFSLFDYIHPFSFLLLPGKNGAYSIGNDSFEPFIAQKKPDGVPQDVSSCVFAFGRYWLLFVFAFCFFVFFNHDFFNVFFRNEFFFVLNAD